jgi:hypothetical protein
VRGIPGNRYSYRDRRKPTSRKEFFDFPLAVRDRIDPGQGQFLDEILDIVEEFLN